MQRPPVQRRLLPPRRVKPESRLERIALLSQNARVTWFGLLALLAFVGVTLLAHQDKHFFLTGVTTALPAIGIDVPTTDFFLAASTLLALAYSYFHVYLIPLWDDLATEKARIGARPLSDHTSPWLVVRSVLWLRSLLRRDGAAPRRRLGTMSSLVTLGLTWPAGPGMLGILWVRSWPLHDEWLSGWLLVCFLSAVWVGSTTGTVVLRIMRGTRHELAHRLRVWSSVLGLSFAVALAALSWVRTEAGPLFPVATGGNGQLSGNSGSDFELWLQDYRRRTGEGDPDEIPLIPTRAETTELRSLALGLRLASADLREVEFVDGSAKWTGFGDWLTALRRESDENARDAREENTKAAIPMFQSAGQEDGSSKGSARKIGVVRVPSWREILDWRKHISELGGPRLDGVDLRAADLRGAFLPGIRLRGADLTGADLSSAILWAANLGCIEANEIDEPETCARLHGVNLGKAQLQGAILTEARLHGADLAGADLTGTELQEAGLAGADMQGAVLASSRMKEAELRGAHMGGAVLDHADLEFAECAGTIFDGALLHSANMLCEGLTQEQLAGAIGDSDTLLPDGRFVYDCWEREPDTFSVTVAALEGIGMSEEQAREEYLCNGREPLRLPRSEDTEATAGATPSPPSSRNSRPDRASPGPIPGSGG